MNDLISSNKNTSICPNCKFVLGEGQSFCPNCGIRIKKQFCSNCGSELLEGQIFCPNCGQKSEGASSNTSRFSPSPQGRNSHKTKRPLILGLIVVVAFLVVFSLLQGKRNPYVGTWYCYKLYTGTEEVYFEDFEELVKMELTVEFDADGGYMLDYYVNGIQGTEYPQEGRYTIEDDRLTFVDRDIYGEIHNNELVLYISGPNGVVQYFKSEP